MDLGVDMYKNTLNIKCLIKMMIVLYQAIPKQHLKLNS